ncbi:13020_t:CDS:1, partial [Cetraspora pellucida]
ETHSEIKDLNDELNQLQEIYQLKYNSDDDKSDNKDNYQHSMSASEDLLFDHIDDELDDYFTLQQIKEFQQIFFQNPIQYTKEYSIK